MKVYFDANVYIAEALLGAAAERLIAATIAARWRIFVSDHLLAEIEQVLVEQLGFSRRFAHLSRLRTRRRATLVTPPASRHAVGSDPNDSPILRAALAAGVDMLVTNDVHLLALGPYEGMRVISMTEYFNLLETDGLIET
jgi:putative PIN family toxin of toxin-antitoxin system